MKLGEPCEVEILRTLKLVPAMKIVLLVLLGLSVGWQANADESYGIFESSDQGETWRIFDQSLNFAGEVEDDCSTPGAAATDASESSLPDEIRLPVANPGSNTTQQTFLRFTNPNNTSTSVELYGIDDDGVLSQKVLNFSLAPNASRQITSQDIENGNASKALTGNICDGRGKWQFRIRCDNEIKVMSLIRTPDGFLTSLNDVVPKVGDDNVVYFANPASNTQQQTFLRVVNLSSESDSVTISAIDDNGTSASGSVSFTLAANESKQMTSQDLENGNISKGLIGSLGDGEGKWQLTVTSVLNLEVMSLIRTQDGFQTNLSGMVDENDAGDHVIYFANPASESVKTTFLRIVNTTDQTGTVTISGVDDNGQSAPGGPVTFTLSPNASKHMTTGDLETGNTGKGLNGMLGDGIGRWQLTVSADVAIRVMSLVRTPDGFLTNMSRTTPVSNGVNEVFIFNPGSNQNQQSMLRIVNTEEVQSRVTISGVDDDGNEAPGGDVIFNLASRAGIVLSAQDLEGGNGGLGLEGALGDGVGKWHLQVSSETDLKVQSLLNTSSGFLTNLSRTVDDSINVLTYYKSSISQPIVQTRCIVCHIVGGVATGSAIRFATTSESGYQDSNYQVLHDYVAGVEGQADTIRDKVRGV